MPSIREVFISAAIEMARANESGVRTKHAALVVRGNRVIGAGANIRKTHPGSGRQQSFHAEFRALKRIYNGDAKGAVLYSFRDGRDKWSRPCVECMTLAQGRGIKLVVSVNALGAIRAERL